LGALFAALILAACVSAPVAHAPEWARDTEAAYPRDRYIAQKGRGTNGEAAKLSALGAVSGYFQTEIQTVTTLEESYAEQDGHSSQSARLDQNTFLRSQTGLFAVRYAEPWYNRAAKEWEALAYIDREEAWTIYEPRVREKTGPFWTLFTEAGAEADPLRQYYLYTAALSLAGREELSPLLDFAQILNPRRAAAFDDLRAALGETGLKAESAKGRVAFYIASDNDMDALLSAAFAAAFTSHAFTVTGDAGVATNHCEARVSENRQDLEAGTFYAPSINVTVTGPGGPLFSYSASVPRQGARNAEVARRRAYAALAGELERTFYGEFSKKMGEGAFRD
jgi:hypothetical protein